MRHCYIISQADAYKVCRYCVISGIFVRYWNFGMLNWIPAILTSHVPCMYTVLVSPSNSRFCFRTFVWLQPQKHVTYSVGVEHGIESSTVMMCNDVGNFYFHCNFLSWAIESPVSYLGLSIVQDKILGCIPHPSGMKPWGLSQFSIILASDF